MSAPIHPFSEESYVQSFAQYIARCRHEGYYCVPLIGAGLSVPSGIPQAAALTRYLTWCFLRVLGLNPWADTQETNRDAARKLAAPNALDTWTPRSGIWPDMAEEWREPVSLSTTQMDRVLKKAIKILENGEAIMDSAGEPARIVVSAELAREVYGALADWRTALLLMSRIDHAPRKEPASGNSQGLNLTMPGRIAPMALDHSKDVILTAPDHSVVDSFFQFQMQGKQPCQGHRMIAALAPVLRMNVILSPNFDNLIEDAFAAINSPLKCFEVPYEVPLPDARLVTRQRSIVKLHGGSFGLRADYSIDEEPDLNDSAKFLSYLAGRPLTPADLKGKEAKYPNRVALMLCGISGKDQRVIAMLRMAREHFEKLKIFWFCHTDRDVASICERFGNDTPVIVRDNIPDGAEIITIRHMDYGALLHQIYQSCTNSIPSAGIRFPATWHMPSAPRIPSPPREFAQEFAGHEQGLQKAIDEQLEKNANRQPILVPFYDGVRGGVTLLSRMFWNSVQPAGQKRSVTTPRHPIWLDLEDVATPAGVFLRLALTLARRGGTANPISSLSLADFYDRENPENRENFQEILVHAFKDHHVRTGECLLIFINAQDTIGSASPFQAEPWQAATAAYRRSTQVVKDYSWFTHGNTRSNIKLVVEMLVEINKDPINGVQFVMGVRQPSRKTPGHPLDEHMCTVFDVLTGKINRSTIDFAFCHRKKVTKNLTNFSPESAVKVAVAYFTGSDKGDQWSQLRRPFLHLVAGFRFAGFEASIVRIMERISFDLQSPKELNADDLAKEVRIWLNMLAELGVIRWKIGGVIWIKGVMREMLRQRLDPGSNADHLLLIESLQARWYGRLLLATSDPLAATESVYHAFRGIYEWLKKVEKNRAEPTDQSIQRLLPMVRHAHGVLNTASAVLEEQLSDQFADHTLMLAEASADAALEACKMIESLSVQEKRKFSLPVELAGCLEACRNDIVTLRINLYLQEGEFGTLLQISKCEDGDIRRSLVSRGNSTFKLEMMNLDIATARFCFRDYEGCEKIFCELWARFVTSKFDGAQAFTGVSGSEAARNWISCTFSDAFTLDERVRLVSRLCRRYVYLRLLQGLARWLQPDMPWKERRDETCRLLKQAQWMGDFGMEALRSVSVTADQFIFDENVRIRAHSALARAILGFHHETDDSLRKSEFGAALTILNDSEAFIEEFPVNDGKLGRVIVELRRAEILLINSGGGSWLRELRDQLALVTANDTTPDETKHRTQDKLVERQVASIRNLVFPAKKSEKQADLHERIAIVYDAMRYLERCEHELGNHPKSRWWWWLCLVLRLHAAEALFTLRLMLPLQGGPKGARIIPHSVVSFVKNELDRRIKQVAMTDVFQLARIVRSYRRLLAAERLHLIRIATSSEEIEKVGEAYDKVFRNLYQYLEKAMEARKLTNEPLDSDVRNFVEGCL